MLSEGVGRGRSDDDDDDDACYVKAFPRRAGGAGGGLRNAHQQGPAGSCEDRIRPELNPSLQIGAAASKWSRAEGGAAPALTLHRLLLVPNRTHRRWEGHARSGGENRASTGNEPNIQLLRLLQLFTTY